VKKLDRVRDTMLAQVRMTAVRAALCTDRISPEAAMTSTHIRVRHARRRARAAELRRVKALARWCWRHAALFVTAKALLHVHPVFGFVAAFAEAATIGGSPIGTRVALFRRPLDCRSAHAIIQSNQHRIADKLGEFIEVHFLEAAPVEAKLRQIDLPPSSRLAARPQAQPDLAASRCGCCPRRLPRRRVRA